MEHRTRALPNEDLAALLKVVSVLDAHLVAGEMPAELTDHLVRGLTRTGALPEGSTPGALNGALSDLAQRLHWAIGTDTEYPVEMPRRTTYQLTVPAGSVAACMAALREAGADDVHGESGGVTAVFAELAPDPAYQERVARLSALAEQHGGRYEGANW